MRYRATATRTETIITLWTPQAGTEDAGARCLKDGDEIASDTTDSSVPARRRLRHRLVPGRDQAGRDPR